MKFCELKKFQDIVCGRYCLWQGSHESLICCEEFPEYEGEKATVPIAPLLDIESYSSVQ